MKIPMILGLIAGSIGALFAAKKVAAMPLPSITINQQPQKENAMTWETPEHGKKYDKLFADAGARYGVPPSLLSRVAYKESNYDPLAVNPKSGAQGLMQFMPATAAEYGVNPFDPASAITGAAKYLSRLYTMFGTWTLALAAYNWGPGNVQRRGMSMAPKETREYISTITTDTGFA